MHHTFKWLEYENMCVCSFQYTCTPHCHLICLQRASQFTHTQRTNQNADTQKASSANHCPHTQRTSSTNTFSHTQRTRSINQCTKIKWHWKVMKICIFMLKRLNEILVLQWHKQHSAVNLLLRICNRPSNTFWILFYWHIKLILCLFW